MVGHMVQGCLSLVEHPVEAGQRQRSGQD